MTSIAAVPVRRKTEAYGGNQMPVKSGRIAVNGLSYYEIYGQGEPHLHGGIGSIEEGQLARFAGSISVSNSA